ncbi:ABC transporter substrate-binding protein [Cohnella yongneupensis]|uniref:ABC transporter substrate-binding protein n=1 Tax=Cohnella yongneupensis TaxID=425006 RepID=A0ABW0R6F9_9BACL
MKKPLLVLITGALMLLFLTTSCTMKKKPQEKAVIHFPITTEYEVKETNLQSIKDNLDPREKLLMDIVEHFNSIQDEVEVKTDFITVTSGGWPGSELDLDSYKNKEGTPFDIYRFNSYAAFDFDDVLNKNPGILLDMSSMYNSSAHATIAQTILQGGMHDDKLLMIPATINFNTMTYNKQIFDELNIPYPDSDWTWEQFSEIASHIRASGSYRGSFLPFEPIDLIRLILNISGNDIFASDGSTAIGYLDSEAAIKAIRWFRFYLVANPQSTRYEDWTESDSTAFEEGKMGIASHYSRNESNKLKTGTVPMPRVAGQPNTIPVYMTGMGISSQSLQPQAAWKFIEYLLLSVNKDSLNYAYGLLPASEPLAQEMGKTEEDMTNLYGFVANGACRVKPYWLERVWNNQLKAQLDEIMSADDSEVPDLMHKLAEAVDKELKRQQSSQQ